MTNVVNLDEKRQARTAADIAADEATTIADMLMPDVRAAEAQVEDKLMFWTCWMEFWLGAVAAAIGEDGAREIERRLLGAPHE